MEIDETMLPEENWEEEDQLDLEDSKPITMLDSWCVRWRVRTHSACPGAPASAPCARRTAAASAQARATRCSDGPRLPLLPHPAHTLHPRRTVIGAYFDEKGLVRQQLDSFDQFISNTVTEVVEDTPVMNLKPVPQYGPGSVNSEVRRCGGRRWQAAARRVAQLMHRSAPPCRGAGWCATQQGRLTRH